ncbi:MAG: tRNA preQ1(34) S-adenosylmethionine ribosyltransferase-isomerase QueA [Bacteroidales bacterium]|nr:tRNA preQ1(34) S-adenosylmethionine ribosyltransferase-isomerase QueA [Bacteroidales bacterium]
MKLSQFKFKLPEERIALQPSYHRDECRMMVLHRKSKKIEHRLFKDFIEYFDEKDLVLFNDTKIFPARLYGNKEKTGARIEVFLLRELNPDIRLWDVLVDPARKIRIGNKLYFGDDESLVAEVIDNTTSRGRTLRFLYDGPHDEFIQILYGYGETPIPPSLKELRDVIDEPVDDDHPFTDRERYQTIFAKAEGGVVAPAAALHFSRELLKRMEIKGVDFDFITVHSNHGNYREIDVEDLSKHKMDSEQMYISEEVANRVNEVKASGHHVCAVDTSVMRAIESSVSTMGTLKPFDGWSNKFIFPPYDFSIADSMVANFYAPLSTLLMMVCAFGGYELVMEGYKQALKEGYKFGCYGDAMLILSD